MKTSETSQKVFAAFAKAQRDAKKPEKSGHNSHTHANYSNLDDMLRAVMPAIVSSGLSMMQFVDGEFLLTRIVHSESGEWFETQVPLVFEKKTSQGLGSAMTYSKRYAISSLFCLNDAQFDDDGQLLENNASVVAPKKSGNVAEQIVAQKEKSPSNHGISDYVTELNALDWVNDFDGAIAKARTMYASTPEKNISKRKYIKEFVDRREKAKNA